MKYIRQLEILKYDQYIRTEKKRTRDQFYGTAHYIEVNKGPVQETDKGLTHIVQRRQIYKSTEKNRITPSTIDTGNPFDDPVSFMVCFA